MTISHQLSRRSLIAAGGGLMAVSAIVPTLVASPARAQTVMPGSSRSMQVGSFRVSTLLDGARNVPEPQGIFGMNVTAEEFAQVSSDNFLPIDQARFFFTPTVIDTGTEVVLFDTGNGGENGNLTAALADAGYTSDQISIVVITHMHPDHIGGLMSNGAAAFPNARYVTGSVEHNFWTSPNAPAQMAEMIGNLVIPLSEQMSFLDDGGAVTGGITAVAGFGHTPGHMTYRIESEGAQLHLIADLANHYVWSLAYPDWEVRFDADKAMAATSRRRLLGMLAADRVPFVGYHMPFPALGYVETAGEGFRYVPASYQFDL